MIERTIGRGAGIWRPWLALACLVSLSVASLFIGVGDVSVAALISGDDTGMLLLLASRIPRTLAILLVGMSMAIAAVLMQLLFRNRFVEPTTTGTAESAGLGLIAVALLAPDLPVLGKMAVAAAASLAGSLVFLRIIDRIRWRTTLVVPLVGLMLGGIVHAVATFLAYRFDLMQSLAAWTHGDFSGVLRGRYELLWVTIGLAAIAYAAADRFTVAGLGEAFSVNLGLDYRGTVLLGLAIVSVVTATCVVIAGSVPFFGLIIVNIVGLMLGDNLRATLPWIAMSGAGFLILCDMAGRLIRFPYEIPVGTVAGAAGGAVFLCLMFTRRAGSG